MGFLKRKIYYLLAVIFLLVMSMLGVTFYDYLHTENLIIVGCKNFTEQHILGEIIAIMIERNSDLKVKRRFNLEGTMVLFNALKSGDVDIYPEYTGTGIVEILKKEPLYDSVRGYELVKEEFLKRFDLKWLDPFGCNSTYVVIMRRKRAENLGMETISDLARYLKKHKLISAFDPEFIARPEYKKLIKTYDLVLNPSPIIMDEMLVYRAVKDKSIDLSIGYKTDGRIDIYDLAILEDDKNIFPKYLAAPVVRCYVLEDHPLLEGILGRLKGQISDKEMQRLNIEVDEKKRKPYDVAFKFLRSKDLIKK